MAINFDIKAPENFLSQLPYKRILAVITVVVATCIFLPDDWLEKLGLLEIRNKCITVLGVIFIISVAVWTIVLATAIYYKFKRAIFCSDNSCRKRFEMLSDEALAIVIAMYKSQSHSLELEISEASTTILRSLHFIGSSSISSYGYHFDYYLEPWAVKYLSKHISEYE